MYTCAYKPMFSHTYMYTHTHTLIYRIGDAVVMSELATGPEGSPRTRLQLTTTPQTNSIECRMRS